ncbi:hypothetical protein SAMN05444422_101668 [Halobiforma haloterrestris]|uniref:Uncharacterized protein n=1 Tax=Natronobacterium haloterrestre TaxID=148448 RepID=A0A1I1DN56_NATHA|nr:hypothetical protein [Halobiforma haloterrestris]SFB74508.1 hypothetical protein SAMN05444422_101668 [Halobiforma haloterrestris]
MHRRRVLERASFGALLGLAGCLGENNTADDPSDTESTASMDDTESAIPDIDAQSCPPYETDHDRVVCSHTVDPDSATVFLEPSPRRSTVVDGTPESEVTLTLHNRSDSELTFNPYSWQLRSDSGSGWRELQQDRAGNGTLTVSAGETHTWSLVDAVTAVREEPDLDPGLYAMELTVPDPERESDRIACIALVRLEAGEESETDERA